MPKLAQGQRSINPTIQLSNYKTAPLGFSLIELLLGIILIVSMVTILLTSTGVLRTRFSTDKHILANRVASREMERLRNMSWESLIAAGSTPFWPSEYSADSDALKKGSSQDPNFNRNITTNYNGDSNIVKVDITILWYNEQGAVFDTTYETLIAKEGL